MGIVIMTACVWQNVRSDKKLLTFFKKPLDKPVKACYNTITG